jgi:hypothetical protein
VRGRTLAVCVYGGARWPCRVACVSRQEAASQRDETPPPVCPAPRPAPSPPPPPHTRTQVSRKYGLARAPKLVEMIAAVPEEHRAVLLPQLRAKPVRTASGVAVVAVMSKPHRCPHIATTGALGVRAQRRGGAWTAVSHAAARHRCQLAPRPAMRAHTHTPTCTPPPQKKHIH